MKGQYEKLDVNNKLIWNLRDIAHTMRQVSEGRGSQKRILIVLWETGPITQRDLTKRLGIQPGSASEVIGKLETAGLIERTTSVQDHRTVDIRLTEEGLLAAREAAEKRTNRHERMFACLDETEKEELLKLLEKVNTAWEEEYWVHTAPWDRDWEEPQKDSSHKICRKGHEKQERI